MISCQSNKRCRRGLRSCNVCRTGRRSVLRTLACVTEKWRSSVGWQQMFWRKRPGPCKQARTEEAAVHLRPMDAVSIQPQWNSFHLGSRSCEATDPTHGRKRRRRSRQMSPPAPGGRNEGCRLVLFLILLVTRMQAVKAVEEEISIRQELGRPIVTEEKWAVRKEVMRTRGKFLGRIALSTFERCRLRLSTSRHIARSRKRQHMSPSEKKHH